MPPWGWWPLAFVGVGLFFACVPSADHARQRFVAGSLFGLSWMLISMAWMWFLTAPGYIAASVIFAAFHGVAALATPAGPLRPVIGAAAHTLAEVVRMTIPFGGVPLATFGISQAGGPFLPVARIGGVILITWLVFQVGASLADVVRHRLRLTRSHTGKLAADPTTNSPSGVGRTGDSLTAHSPVAAPDSATKSSVTAKTSPTDGSRTAAVGALTCCAAVIALAFVAPHGSDLGRRVDVAAVQGGGEQGTSALQVPAALVTAVHLDATRTIEPDPDLDMVVWPENGIDVNRMAFDDSDQFDAVAAEAARLDVPILVGVTDDSEYSLNPRPDSFVNAQVVVTPGGEATDRYEKVQIVPFGEYVPLRGLIESLGIDLSQVPSDATRGQAPAVLDLPDGTPVGVMISWEVFFGRRARAAVDAGAEMLINPTNGASYTTTIVQTQQVASSRLRAMETGRWVVQVAPTGFSAFVSPDGEVFDRTDVSERAVIRRTVPLRTGSTWYTQLGDRPFAGVCAAVCVSALVVTRRRTA